MHLQHREENTSESTGGNLSVYTSGEELLQKAWTLVLILSSFHTYLRLFNENRLRNVWIRAQNYSSFPQTSCLWIFSPIFYNIKLYFVPSLPLLTSAFFSLYTDVTPAMGQVLSCLTLLPSLAYGFLNGESLCTLASPQAEDRISSPPSWWQPVKAF